MSQTERLYWIDAQIHAGRYPNAQAVSAHFEVSLRAAYADRAYLINRLGAPLKTDRQRSGWYYTDPTWMLPFLALSEQEASALRRSLLAAQDYLAEADAQVVGLLLERMAPYLSGSPSPESFSSLFHLATAARINADLLEACRHGVQNRQKLWLHYRGNHRDEESKRVVHPYRLHYFQSEPHLIGWCEWRRDVRQFFLGRVLDWKLLEPERAFVPDPDFDLETYLRKGFAYQHSKEMVRVRVRFSAYQARWIRERRYHTSQQIEEQPDGGLILSLQVAGLDEVKRWLLSFGAEADALEPTSLRAEVIEQVKKLAAIYGVSLAEDED